VLEESKKDLLEKESFTRRTKQGTLEVQIQEDVYWMSCLRTGKVQERLKGTSKQARNSKEKVRKRRKMARRLIEAQERLKW